MSSHRARPRLASVHDFDIRRRVELQSMWGLCCGLSNHRDAIGGFRSRIH